MNTITAEMLNEVALANAAQAARFEAEAEKFAQQWAEKVCPFKIGETVKVPQGTTHAGKLVKIDRITGHVASTGDHLSWQASGKTITQDGRDGAFRAHIYSWTLSGYIRAAKDAGREIDFTEAARAAGSIL